MGVNPQIYNSPAVKGDITGTAINTSIALTAIERALLILASPEPADPQEAALRAQKLQDALSKIQRSADNLSEAFDTLAGWTDD